MQQYFDAQMRLLTQAGKQFAQHYPEHAGTRHDADEDAPVRLDLADYGVPADCGDAGPGRCGDHDADGHQLRHQLL